MKRNLMLVMALKSGILYVKIFILIMIFNLLTKAVPAGNILEAFKAETLLWTLVATYLAMPLIIMADLTFLPYRVQYYIRNAKRWQMTIILIANLLSLLIIWLLGLLSIISYTLGLTLGIAIATLALIYIFWKRKMRICGRPYYKIRNDIRHYKPQRISLAALFLLKLQA